MDLTIARQRLARKNPGLVTASAPGVDGGDHPHIITYDPNRTWLFQAVFCAKDLTVCGSPLVWVKHLLGVLYAILAAACTFGAASAASGAASRAAAGVGG